MQERTESATFETFDFFLLDLPHPDEEGLPSSSTLLQFRDQFVKADKTLKKETHKYLQQLSTQHGSSGLEIGQAEDVTLRSALWNIWRSTPDLTEEYAAELAANLEATFSKAFDSNWLGIVPLEPRFRGFDAIVPLITNKLSIVNVPPDCGDDVPSPHNRLAMILKEQFGVNIISSPELANQFSKAANEYMKSISESLGRGPQPYLIGQIGSMADPSLQFAVGCPEVESFLIPVSFCVSMLDILDKFPEQPPEQRIPHAGYIYSSAPKHLVMMPHGALLVNQPTGESYYTWFSFRGEYVIPIDFWNVNEHPDLNLARRHQLINQPQFLGIWRSLVEPYLELRERLTDKPGKRFLKAIENAIYLISTTQNVHLHHTVDLVLSCVMATETILDPFDESKDGLKERFALFGSALVARKKGDRLGWYRRAKSLYDYRSKAAHQGRVLSRGIEIDASVRDAVLLFYWCIVGIYSYAQCELSTPGGAVKSNTFSEFYQRLVLGGGTGDS